MNTTKSQQRTLFVLSVICGLGFVFSGYVAATTLAEQLTTAVQKNSISTGRYVDETMQSKQLTSTKDAARLLAAQNKASTIQTVRSANVSHHSNEFDIFSVQSTLIADWDYDGYFHKFSITFDADVQRDMAQVYAVLYLSREGGPWEQFFVTDTFTVYGDSTTDSYQVVTKLAEGYVSADYNVLIDLYEVGDDYPVATASDLTTSALYGLPLEDQQRDHDNEVRYVEVHESYGGSISWGLILLVFMIFMLREYQRETKPY
jgi:hypothetical protein